MLYENDGSLPPKKAFTFLHIKRKVDVPSLGFHIITPASQDPLRGPIYVPCVQFRNEGRGRVKDPVKPSLLHPQRLIQWPSHQGRSFRCHGGVGQSFLFLPSPHFQKGVD